MASKRICYPDSIAVLDYLLVICTDFRHIHPYTYRPRPELDDFAKGANKVVKRTIDKSTLSEKLLSYSAEYGKDVGVGVKRVRKETELIKESRAQDESLSPRKKKKGPLSKVKPNSDADKTANVERKEAKKAKEKAQEETIKQQNEDIASYKPLSTWACQFGEQEIPTLKNTGRHVFNSELVIQEQFGVDSANFLSTSYERIPVPPKEVLQFFRTLDRPDVRAFITAFCEHFATETDHSHQCYEREEPAFSYLDLLESSDSSNQNLDCANRINTEQTPVKSKSAKDHSKSTIIVPTQNTPQSNFKQKTPELRRSPRKTATTVTPQKELTVQGHSMTPTLTKNTAEVYPTQLTPSPTVTGTVAYEKKMARLIEPHDVFVNMEDLKKVKSRAKTDKRPGYYVTLKLMPLVFTMQEMAGSRGQGIKPAKKGDFRPVLDQMKIRAIKDYSEAYCRRNKIPESSDGELNEAITEAVAYARKKYNNLKKTAEK